MENKQKGDKAMAQRTSYSIQVTFKNGIIKRWNLVNAYSTFKHWDKNIKLDMFDSLKLKDAKRLLGIARQSFPKPDFKIVKSVVKRELLKY